MRDSCACAPGCPARCVPERTCDQPGCPCYEMWGIEVDELVRQTAGLTAAEIHQMATEIP